MSIDAEVAGESEIGMVTATPSQRLRIAQVIRGAAGWGDIGPAALERGIGGRETAVIQLADQWAQRGHDVVNFVPTTRPAAYRPDGYMSGYVTYVNVRAAPLVLASEPFDVIVSWEDPNVFLLPGVAEQGALHLIGMQVAHLPELDPMTPLDGVVCLSGWAADLLARDCLIARESIYVVPNGVDLSRYPSPEEAMGLKWQPLRAFWSSSPDRGLHHLLKLWPRVRAEVWKDAELRVAYGAMRWVEEVKWTHLAQGEVALDIASMLKQEGVTDVGLVGQHELAKLQAESVILPYTCDTMGPTETGCITVTEAMAAMAAVVTTDCDCLPSEYGRAASIVPLPFDEDGFLAEMDRVIKDDDYRHDMLMRGRALAQERTWQRTSAGWLKVMTSLIAQR